MTIWEGILWGIIGGFGAELLGWFRLRHNTSEPDRPRLGDPWYLLPTVGMILFGGAIVVAYMRSNVPITPILAVNVGAAAPALLGGFIAQFPKAGPGKVD